VSGTPADCVKIAYWALLEEKRPDLLISGINHGSNTGINVIYSGTASAATEGTILEIPSIAISLATYEEADFSFAAKFGQMLALKVLEKGLQPGSFLNVNVPAIPDDQIEGVEITRQGMAMFREKFDKRTDPHNKTYYWLTGQKINLDQEPSDADDVAILNKRISITPIHYDLTSYELIESLRSWDLKVS
jgi:5'-nucleotidase